MQGSPALNPMTPEELHPSVTLALPTHICAHTDTQKEKRKEGKEEESQLLPIRKDRLWGTYIRLQEKQGQSPELGQDIVH